jgi:hypothetical protein
MFQFLSYAELLREEDRHWSIWSRTWCAHLAEAEQLLHERRWQVWAAAPDPPNSRGIGACSFPTISPRDGSSGGVGVDWCEGRELHPPLLVLLPTANVTAIVWSNVPHCGG